LFVRAVRQQDFGAPASAELTALGGDFAARALRSGWADANGCIASDDELVTLFVLRWKELTRLGENPRFKPRLSELRAYYRFLLLYPEGGVGPEAPRLRAAARLRYVMALERRDREYPGALARGSLLGALGMNSESAAALGEHLEGGPSRVWSLRARNYLLSVAAPSDEEP
jgi:hypothetical protein